MDTFDNFEQEEIKQDEKRPQILTVVGVLSLVSMGISFVSQFKELLGGPASKEEIRALKAELAGSITEMKQLGIDGVARAFEQLGLMTEALNNHFYASGISTLIVILVGLSGVLLMFKRRKLGFHLYISYSLLSIIQLYLFVSPVYVPTFLIIWTLLISVVFIFLYSKALKWMK